MLTVDVSAQLHEGLSLRASVSTRTTSWGISGPSGAGKSSLLRVLAGLDRRARGTVRFGDVTWLDSARSLFIPPWQRYVGWVAQDALLFPHLSVRENALFGVDARESDLARVAADLEIDALLDRRPRNLSGGERQRVALARALLSSPKLLLLDEPFSALDRARRRRMCAVLKRLREERQLPMVIVSHDREDLDELADAQFTMDGGLLAEAERRA